MTSERVYHGAVTSYEALKRLYEWRGTGYEEMHVLQFIQCVGIYPVGSVVQLSTGDTALVISTRPRHRLAPRVRLILDQHGQPYAERPVVDLLDQPSTDSSRPLSILRVLDASGYSIDIREQLIQDLGVAGEGTARASTV